MAVPSGIALIQSMALQGNSTMPEVIVKCTCARALKKKNKITEQIHLMLRRCQWWYNILGSLTKVRRTFKPLVVMIKGPVPSPWDQGLTN